MLRYQLVANATYLPKGHLVVGATYFRLRLRFAKPRFSTPFQHDSMMLPAGLGLALR